MLGVGGSEIVVIALIFLLVFGPSKMPEIARDIGKFVAQARGTVDEFKGELTVETEIEQSRYERPPLKREYRSRKEHSHQLEKECGSLGEDDTLDKDLEEQTFGDSRREYAEYDL